LIVAVVFLFQALVITADGKVSHNAQITLPYNTGGTWKN
jgi:hypothetical protein